MDKRRIHKGLDLGVGTYTTEEAIDSWLSYCVNSNYKELAKKKGINKEDIFYLIKQKAFIAQKKGVYDFRFIYKIEEEISDLIRVDKKVKFLKEDKKEKQEIINTYIISFKFKNSEIIFKKPKDAIEWYQKKFSINYSLAKNRIYNSLKRNTITPDGIICKKIYEKDK